MANYLVFCIQHIESFAYTDPFEKRNKIISVNVPSYVDAFAENALREAVAAYRDRDYLATRAARADDAAFAAVLAKIPDVEPDPQDRW